MRIDLALAAALLMALPAIASAQERAQFHWVMHCQGCHGVAAQGSPDGAPPLSGRVSRFLHVDEGRAYLGRVPGVAFVGLTDAEVADLLNWVVLRFDAKHLPLRFKPYSGGEIRLLRQHPLISGAAEARRNIVKGLGSSWSRP